MEQAEQLSELVSAEGRNRKAVLCQRCGSRVLQPGTALFSRRQVGRQARGPLHPRALPEGPRRQESGSGFLHLRRPRPALRGRQAPPLGRARRSSAPEAGRGCGDRTAGALRCGHSRLGPSPQAGPLEGSSARSPGRRPGRRTWARSSARTWRGGAPCPVLPAAPRGGETGRCTRQPPPRCYDPIIDSWEVVTSMGTQRCDAGVCVLREK